MMAGIYNSCVVFPKPPCRPIEAVDMFTKDGESHVFFLGRRSLVLPKVSLCPKSVFLTLLMLAAWRSALDLLLTPVFTVSLDPLGARWLRVLLSGTISLMRASRAF